MNQGNEQERIDQEIRLKENMSKIKQVFLVMSGKGGVGKSTVAVNLAYTLALKGKKTGIMDIDLHGPNIAKMLGIEGKTILSDEFGIVPVKVNENLKAISLALFGTKQDAPFIWRGPMKSGAIKQFLSDVHWGELDYLIIDSPPGTGDEPLSVCQFIPKISGAVIVSTPQDVAVLDARKSIQFARELRIPIAGIIENMSGYFCPHCQKEVNLFKKGGAENAAEEMHVPFLGRIPFDPEMVELGDRGTPFVSHQSGSLSVKAFEEIVRLIEEQK